MKKLLPGLLLLFIFAACSEDEPGTDNKYEKLTNDDWHFSEWIISYEYGGTEFTTDLYSNPGLASADPCILDDYITFYNDKSYQTKPGAVICDANLSMFGNGNWQIINDSLSLEPYGISKSIKFEVVELSDSVLKFSQLIELSNPNGGESVEGTETFTYRHK